MASMTTENVVLSAGLIASGRLKNIRDVDKCSFLRHCLSVRGGFGLYLCRQNWSNGTLSPVIKNILG